jgi:uncharacterized protein YutE (UPF0331/DUF86 family)
MADSIVINNAASIERCLTRIKDDYEGNGADFESNFMRQDAVLLNLQRACKLSIDLGNHLIMLRKLGIPQNSQDTFEILGKEGVISEDLMRQMIAMVGFRNIAVNEYSKLNIKVVMSILENRLHDFTNFVKIAIQAI